MRKLNIFCLFTGFLIFLTGCTATESSDRLYTKEIHIKNDSVNFIFFDNSNIQINSENVRKSLKEAENSLGKDIFTSHTNAIVLDNNNFSDTLQILRDEFEISDLCKISLGYDDFQQDFNLFDITKTCEENITLPESNISSILDELLSPAGFALINDLNSDSTSSAIISDNSVVAYLKENAQKGIAFLHNSAKDAVFTSSDETFEIKNIKRTFKVDFYDDNPAISIIISFKCSENCSDIAIKYIETIVNSAIEQTLKKGYDVLGICNLIRQKNYNYYAENKNNLTNCLENADYNISVSLK